MQFIINYQPILSEMARFFTCYYLLRKKYNRVKKAFKLCKNGKMFHIHSFNAFKRIDLMLRIRVNWDKDFDLLVSGDAMVETITGGPVRRESF